MDRSHKNFYLLVIVGMILATALVVLIFVLINRCISRAGRHRLMQLPRRTLINVESNKYQGSSFSSVTPPLPPRTQFLTADVESYENLAQVPDHKRIAGDYERAEDDYEQAEPDDKPAQPVYEPAYGEYEEADYLKVEDKEESFFCPPPPPPPYEDPAKDNTSTEEYDDIGGSDENQDEDYDDVG